VPNDSVAGSAGTSSTSSWSPSRSRQLPRDAAGDHIETVINATTLEIVTTGPTQRRDRPYLRPDDILDFA